MMKSLQNQSLKQTLLVVLCFLLYSITSQAQLTQIDSRDEFETLFPNSIFESWDDNPSGTSIAQNGNLDGITYTSNLDQDFSINLSQLPTTPTQVLGREGNNIPARTFFEDAIITFSFETSILGFGIDLIDSFFSNYNNDGIFEATTSSNQGGSTLSKSDPFISSIAAERFHFIGFTSDIPFQSVTIKTAADTVFSRYVLDSLRIVSAPVSSTITMNLLLILSTAFLIRRSRARAQA